MAVPILAVDDSAPIREMIAAVLTPHGYHVLTARGGREALEMLRTLAEPYIILLDVVMPDLDGPAVVRAIDQDDDLRGVGHQVILMSSPLRLAARDIPATAGQLAKPFTRQQLITSIQLLSS